MRRILFTAASALSVIAGVYLALHLDTPQAIAESRIGEKWFGPFFGRSSHSHHTSRNPRPPRETQTSNRRGRYEDNRPTAEDGAVVVTDEQASSAGELPIPMTEKTAPAAEGAATGRRSSRRTNRNTRKHDPADHTASLVVARKAHQDGLEQRFEQLKELLPDEPADFATTPFDQTPRAEAYELKTNADRTAPVPSTASDNGSSGKDRLSPRPAIAEEEAGKEPPDPFSTGSGTVGSSRPLASTRQQAKRTGAGSSPASFDQFPARQDDSRTNDSAAMAGRTLAQDRFDAHEDVKPSSLKTSATATQQTTNATSRGEAFPFEADGSHNDSPGYQADVRRSGDSILGNLETRRGLSGSLVTLGTSAAGLTVRWKTPGSLNLGEEAICRLEVQNEADQPASEVTVHIQLPKTARFVRSRPATTDGADGGGVLSWRLGQLKPQQTASIELVFIAKMAGSLEPTATVTSTRSSSANIEILDPRLTIAIKGADTLALDQAATYTLRITNTGTGPARRIVLTTLVDALLQTGGKGGREYTIGTLLPGQSREVRLAVSGSSAGSGHIAAHVRAASNLTADAQQTVSVLEPELSLAVEGPKLRYVNRPANYKISVHNSGPAVANNVQVFDLVPEGFRFANSSSGGTYDRETREVAWFVGRLQAGQTAEVDVRLIPLAPGDHRVVAAAVADASAIARAEFPTRVKGAANLVMEVIDTDDPVEVGGETTYEIRLINRGNVPAHGVQVAVLLGDEIRAVDATGPTRAEIDSDRIVFDKIPSLAPRQVAAYQVKAKCLSQGRARLRAYVRSDEAREAVLEEESTRIYAD